MGLSERTPEHEAALDALEGMVKLHVCGPEQQTAGGYAEDCDALAVMVASGRMEWVDTGCDVARFVTVQRFTEEDLDAIIGAHAEDFDGRTFREYLRALRKPRT